MIYGETFEGKFSYIILIKFDNIWKNLLQILYCVRQ